MKLYNQSHQPLKWDMAGSVFACGAFASIDIPDHLVEFVKRRKLPLESAPVAPEQRAHEDAERAKKDAEAAEVLQLKEKLALAEAALATARQELERESGVSGKLSSKAAALESKLREANDELKRGAQDRAALDTKLVDVAAELAELKSEEKRKPRGKPERG